MELLIEYFLNKPKQLNRPAKEFSSGERGKGLFTHLAEHEVEEIKNKAKEKLNQTNTIEHSLKQTKVNVEKGTLESTVVSNFEPKDDAELAVLHRVNLDKYKIATYYSKQLPSSKFTSTVLAVLKKPQDYTMEDFVKFLSSYKPEFTSVKKENHKLFPIDIEVSIADFHLAKKTFEKESIQDKKEQFLSVIKDLVNKVISNYYVEKIVFPISNDFFHSDNYQNQTTNGTPQDVLVEYDKEYEEGFDLLVKAITFLKENCDELEVILVQGNHDRTKSFYLAHALEIFFKSDNNISFQREHSTVKSIVLGNTFIGYHHGNCKIEDLPLLFATGKDSFKFGKAKYREVHTGDKHHYMAKEVKGVRIQQMPSLSGVDRWHSDNNYVNNIRAGIVTMYDNQNGRIGEFESRI